MLKPEKVAAEIKAFSDEVIVENGPRYLDVGEWHHLWVDIWVSMFSMSYTLGHLTAYVIPILLLWWWLRSSHVRRRRGRRRLRWIRDLQRAVSGPVTHAVMEVRRT